MKRNSIILLAIVSFVCLFQATNALQLQQRSVQELQAAQRSNNLIENSKSGKHKSKKSKKIKEQDESDEYEGPGFFDEE